MATQPQQTLPHHSSVKQNCCQGSSHNIHVLDSGMEERSKKRQRHSQNLPCKISAYMTSFNTKKGGKCNLCSWRFLSSKEPGSLKRKERDWKRQFYITAIHTCLDAYLQGNSICCLMIAHINTCCNITSTHFRVSSMYVPFPHFFLLNVHFHCQVSIYFLEFYFWKKWIALFIYYHAVFQDDIITLQG